jgi:hypothetical protein
MEEINYMLMVAVTFTSMSSPGPATICMDDGKAVNLVINLDDGERLETRKVKKSKKPIL